MKRREFVKGVMATVAASLLPMTVEREMSASRELIIERLNIVSVSAVQTHLSCEGRWERVKLAEIQLGDVFRAFLPDGTPVKWQRLPKEPYTVCVAKVDPFHGTNGPRVIAYPWDEEA